MLMKINSITLKKKNVRSQKTYLHDICTLPAHDIVITFTD